LVHKSETKTVRLLYPEWVLENNLAGDASSMKSLVAYEKIRDMILVGEKLPGSRLTLSDLEEKLGIGRGPIREALMRLDRSGLVKNIPYKGAVVASPPSKKEIYILFDIRQELEAQLVSEAINNLTPDILSEIVKLHERMKTIDRGFYALDREFHKAIHETANMPHISAIIAKLVESVETFLTLYRQDPADKQRFIKEHDQIVKAIIAGDTTAACEAMRTNILSGLEIVERTFSRFNIR
jgi:DNA-binding GntR family transcriptional regulator